MAVSVDSVYQTVLLILNSEQRGYMTPSEFNYIGGQVQREIYEKYFDDLNQQVRIPQTDMDYSNRIQLTDEKLAEFKKESLNLSVGVPSAVELDTNLTADPQGADYFTGNVYATQGGSGIGLTIRITEDNLGQAVSGVVENPGSGYAVGDSVRLPFGVFSGNDAYFKITALRESNVFTTPEDLYRLGSLTYTRPGSLPVEVQRVTRSEMYNIVKSPLTSPDLKKPIYLYEDNKLTLFPESITDGVKVQYLKIPKRPRWGYEVGPVGEYRFTTYEYVEDGISDSYGSSPLADSIIQNTTNATITPSIPINPTQNTGQGKGASFSFVLGNAGEISTIKVSNFGSGFRPGDELTFDKTNFGSSDNLIVKIQPVNLMKSTTAGYCDFELHNSESTELVLKILLYAGVVLKDPSIINTAAQKIQQEENNQKA